MKSESKLLVSKYGFVGVNLWEYWEIGRKFWSVSIIYECEKSLPSLVWNQFKNRLTSKSIEEGYNMSFWYGDHGKSWN